MREFISVAAHGNVLDTTDEVIITFYGPRGGRRAIQGISTSEAEKLIILLNEAIKHLKHRRSTP